MATSLTTLGLELPTDPRWTDIASMQIGDVLIDHAYCEQKAASSCISLIVHYPDKALLVETLTPIVAEEWGHFQRVLKELKKRNIPLGRQRKDEYVNQLMQLVTKGDANKMFLDRLLICGLIEARSCERFKLLSENLEDESLQKFYRELMISEAGHYRTFLELAETYVPAEKVRARWKELLHAEAEIMLSLSPRGDRIH
ncbi:tRNA-(ms[2]io[6]A)-hydroxylase [Dyadobacter sp. BE34]|uniref:tRNA-(Ms[2]io[6]A)-hydroxylase n=1 Tax=Dyadobacter fermentans TaxID=94254 RepID=A0ABU1R247_9BACT|nr:MULTISPECIES: tRNA-(ms[2]io[6]A)-hydroxylase [Dyadobacter]MDR6807483.1 tRNA-(ms[2]io[6]A)-hydroxylase [Dyadobacter fermentans]MDR7045224.1 tRNA-(ms[2]io[6]A)-hydroxylase [Dyadobacter sp. BE242]MDR7199039.1 tRNA-(ms[2]io[6]A)-hydroxylase [Dyadobacter sp. BE34]MDR7216999.1 tRNA-(ms[2]io[6]A)-hydroxylase [Dyadobacter sp. BE31]MDR7264932.1 tRNA-(ms[2]io[6]A)-hydroxylase [Dyadobacter sp. BE32]